jgi:hypothetical protein
MDGHWVKSNELFDGLADCDISRVYTGTTLRRWKEKD